MSLVKANFDPSRRQLIQFGVLCSLVFPLLAWWWGAAPSTILWLALIGLAIAVLSFSLPKLIKPIFVGLMLVTLPIGMVVSEIVLLIVYVVVFLPIGLCFQMMRRDKLQLEIDRQCATYWQPKKQPSSVKNYYRQS